MASDTYAPLHGEGAAVTAPKQRYVLADSSAQPDRVRFNSHAVVVRLNDCSCLSLTGSPRHMILASLALTLIALALAIGGLASTAWVTSDFTVGSTDISFHVGLWKGCLTVGNADADCTSAQQLACGVSDKRGDLCDSLYAGRGLGIIAFLTLVIASLHLFTFARHYGRALMFYTLGFFMMLTTFSLNGRLVSETEDVLKEAYGTSVQASWGYSPFLIMITWMMMMPVLFMVLQLWRFSPVQAGGRGGVPGGDHDDAGAGAGRQQGGYQPPLADAV